MNRNTIFTKIIATVGFGSISIAGFFLICEDPQHNDNIRDTYSTSTGVDSIIRELAPQVVNDNPLHTRQITFQSDNGLHYLIKYPYARVGRETCNSYEELSVFEFCFEVEPEQLNWFQIIDSNSGEIVAAYKLADHYSFLVTKGNTGGPYSSAMDAPQISYEKTSATSSHILLSVAKWSSFSDSQATQEEFIALNPDDFTFEILGEEKIEYDYTAPTFIKPHGD